MVREAADGRRLPRPATARRCRTCCAPRATPAGRAGAHTRPAAGAEGRRRRRCRRRGVPAAARLGAARGRRRAAARARRRRRSVGRAARAAVAAARRRRRVDVSELRYEVMYFLDLDDARIGAFKRAWGAIGDSIVVVGGDGLWNCHVHTNDIGAAIEVALDLGGRPRQIRVTDLFEEVADEHAHREAAMVGGSSPFVGPSTALPPVTCAVVAVASGDGSGRAVRQPRRAGRRHRRPDAQPVDGRAARRRRSGQRRPSGRPAEQQEHHPRRRAARRADHQARRSSCRRTSMPAALAALVVYDPEADAADEPRRDDRRHRVGDTGEVTRAVRDTASPAGRSSPATGSASCAATASLRSAARSRARPPRLLDHLVTGDSEIVTDHHRCRRDVGADRSARRVAGRRTSGRRGRGAPRRAAAVPVPLRRRVTRRSSVAPLTLRELDEIDVDRLRGVGERKLAALQAFGIASVLDLLTFYPRRWVDRTNEARVSDLDRRQGGAGARRRFAASPSGSRKNRKTMVTAVVGDGSGRLTITFFNQPWREKQLHEGLQHLAVRQARRVPRRAADDEPDRRPDRRPHRPHRADLPAEREGRAEHMGDRRLRRERARAMHARAASPTPLPWPVRAAARSRSTAPTRCALIHLPETMADQARARRRLAFDELLRVQTVLVVRKRALERESLGIRHDISGELVGRLHAGAAVRADRRAAPGDRRDRGRSRRRRIRCTGCCRATSASGKTLVAVSAMLTAVQGGHQAALMAPTEVLAEQHATGVRRLLADVTRARSRQPVRRPTAARRAADQPHHRRRAHATCWRAWPTAASTSRSARTR